MKLRHKFGMLGFFYVVTLAANVALCSWCLQLYHESFLDRAGADPPVAIVLPLPESGPEAAADAPPTDSADQAAEDGRLFGAGEGQVLRILGLNAAFGVALGVLGLRLVRRWVMMPVAGLRDAAVKIGQGDLSHPLRVYGGDELGELGTEVKSMASSILSMREQVLEQERRQAAVQALRCIVHNIRSPLTGIRWVAEAVGSRSDVDGDTVREQELIVRTVDDTLAWLGSFRESLLAGQKEDQGGD